MPSIIKDRQWMLDTLEDESLIIKDEIVDHRRWSVTHRLIFKNDDGKIYQAFYSVGATESQDESPWEYEDKITCREVEPIQIQDYKEIE